MENIKSFVISIVVVLAISEIVSFLCPNSSAQKGVKVISSLIILILFFMPLLKVYDFDIESIDPDFFNIENSDLLNSINDDQINYSSLQSKEIVEMILENNDYHYKNVEVIVNINEDKSIYINEIKIQSGKRDAKTEEKINKEIYSLFKINGEFYEA